MGRGGRRTLLGKARNGVRKLFGSFSPQNHCEERGGEKEGNEVAVG